MMLISVQEASDWLRLDADDPSLPFIIEGISKAVMNYIQGPGIDGFTDSFGDVVEDSSGIAEGVPHDVKLATATWVADVYKNREPTPSDPVPAEYGYGYPPRAVTAQLYFYRTPTLA